MIVSKTSGKIKALIIFMLFLGTALLVMKYVRDDNTPIWVMCIPWGMGLLFSLTLKTVTYEKHAISTLYWITRKQKKLDTFNVGSLQIRLNEASTANNIGIAKRTRVIVIMGVQDKVLHVVDEYLQEHFEDILVMLQEGFKDKWLEEDLS
ncbi:MAG: hypothetical protein GQ574_29285 [Crocinitomix sp.]|nr:hypothetical protein [Crocinitomix sp.]